MLFIYFLFGLAYIILITLIEPTSNPIFKLLILRDYKKVEFNSEYYRNILKYSPSEILFILEKGFSNEKLNSYGLINKYKKMFYVNLLKMHMLGYVTIKFNNNENFEIIKNDVLILDEEYKLIYDYIFNFITYEESIMLEDINKYVENKYQEDYFYEEWENLVRNKLSQNGFYSNNFVNKYKNIIKVYYIVGILFLFIFGILLLINAATLSEILQYGAFYLALIVLGYCKTKDIKMHSSWSVYEYKKVKALKKFLKEFTIINERPAEYIKLLEDYIVYAAIFDMHDYSPESAIEEIKLFIKTNIFE